MYVRLNVTLRGQCSHGVLVTLVLLPCHCAKQDTCWTKTVQRPEIRMLDVMVELKLESGGHMLISGPSEQHEHRHTVMLGSNSTSTQYRVLQCT